MTNKRLSSKWYIITVILTLFSISSGVLTAAQEDTPGYVILSFNNISAEKGLEYLTDAKIGDVSHLPGSPTVFVTSSIPANLQKAEIIRDLVDCSREYEIRFIPLTAKELPSGKQIANNIGTIAIGNFSNPPAIDGNSRTVIDIRDDKIIIIAPSKKMDRIVNTIEKLQNTSSQNTSEQTTTVRDSWLDSRVPNLESRPNITPSLLAENVSKDIQDENNLNQRITDPAPVEKESSYQAKPIQTKSNLLAENSLVDISSIPNPDGEISVDLPEQLTLLELIGWAGPNLQMDFMYNAGELSGAGTDVTINPNGVLRGRIKVRDLYNYLDTILQFKGFAMVRGPNNLVIIVKKESVPNINPAFVQTDQRSIEAGDSVVIDTFELKYISTEAAKKFLGNMNLGIQITDIPENKKLMITEYTSRMPRIRALLDIVDRPGEKKLFRYRQLQHTEPQTLVPKIQSLAEKLNTVSITISTSSTTEIPEQPVRLPGESDNAYNNRMRQYQLKVRQITEANARGSTTSTSSPGESVDPTVFIDSDERTNRILMIGLAKQLDDVEDLIDTLDVAQKDPRKPMIYKIEFLGAEEVMKQLQDLNVIPNNQETKDSPQSRTTRPSRITGGAEPREVTISPTPASSDQGDGDTLQAVGAEPLVVVTSTNSLLIIATEGQHERIASIINLVDKEREEIPFKIFQLKNTGPEHVLSILEPLIEEKIRGPEDKIESVVPKQDEQITIVADSNTSSLIVNANKKNQDWIESLIKVLDKRRPQVLIDVTLVQITKNDAFNYDLNLISSIPDLTNTSSLTSAILPGVSSGASNLVEPLINSGRRNFLDFQSNSGAGVGFYGDKHINALLTMMEEKDYGRVMAKPKILVNDNQLGKIESKDVIYVEKTSSIPLTTGGTGNEPSVGTVTTSIDYTPYDTGVWMDITPHISESNLLRLDIRLERSDVTKLYTSNRPPDTTNSIVETKVTVPDQSTIILGGLTKLNQNKGGAKVPLLGDLPLIGAAFRKTRNSDNQRNLYVFVKAEIIRPPDEEGGRQEELERISQINREAFENYEREFQEYQSFPGIKPTPMGPTKVLEY